MALESAKCCYQSNNATFTCNTRWAQIKPSKVQIWFWNKTGTTEIPGSQETELDRFSKPWADSMRRWKAITQFLWAGQLPILNLFRQLRWTEDHSLQVFIAKQALRVQLIADLSEFVYLWVHFLDLRVRQFVSLKKVTATFKSDAWSMQIVCKPC